MRKPPTSDPNHIYIPHELYDYVQKGKINMREFILWCTILAHDDGKGWTVNLTTLTEKMKCSQEEAKEDIEHLEEIGLLKVIRGDKENIIYHAIY